MGVLTHEEKKAETSGYSRKRMGTPGRDVRIGEELIV